MKKTIVVFLTSLASVIALGGPFDIPFNKIIGEYRLSNCSGSAMGDALEHIEKRGNGTNPCDTYDFVRIAESGAGGLFTFSKSKEKIDAELKAVKGKPKAEIDDVLYRVGIFTSIRAAAQSEVQPNPEINYVETANSMLYTNKSKDTKMSIRIKANAAGVYTFEMTFTEKYEGDLIGQLVISGLLTK